jgi:hypothetical protein
MVFSMLDEAFDLLPPARLRQLVGRYLHLEDLGPTDPGPNRETPKRLRTAVEAFATASRRGDYYEAFDVNSKNCNEQSNGTIAWIAECHRLLDRAVKLSTRRRGAGDVVAAFELLFNLIDDVDACDVEILFFADEGGAYEIGVPWGTVMEAWFDCFAHHAAKGGCYEQRVAAIIERGCKGAGEASQRMARTVWKREPPAPAERANRTTACAPAGGSRPQD